MAPVEMAAGERPLIEASELYRFYHAGDDEVFALRGVSLSIGAGEMVAVVGPSGSGKSTLLACLAGLDEPDGGHVEVAGERMTRRAEPARTALRSRSLGILLQSGNLFDHLTVAQNIVAAQRLATGARRRSVSELLSAVGVDGRTGARPCTLSGGEMARAGLAVALANDPLVLLADEPTGEVDAAAEAGIVSCLLQETQKGTAVMVVTHSERVAASADRIIRLEDGRIVHG